MFQLLVDELKFLLFACKQDLLTSPTLLKAKKIVPAITRKSPKTGFEPPVICACNNDIAFISTYFYIKKTEYTKSVPAITRKRVYLLIIWMLIISSLRVNTCTVTCLIILFIHAHHVGVKEADFVHPKVSLKWVNLCDKMIDIIQKIIRISEYV